MYNFGEKTSWKIDTDNKEMEGLSSNGSQVSSLSWKNLIRYMGCESETGSGIWVVRVKLAQVYGL